MGLWVDCCYKLLCQTALEWFAHHTYSPIMPFASFAFSFSFPLLVPLIFSPFLSQMPHWQFLCFLLLRKAVVLQPKESIEKGYIWLGGLAGASWGCRAGALMARCQWDLQEATLHHVRLYTQCEGSEWICASLYVLTQTLGTISDQYMHISWCDISESNRKHLMFLIEARIGFLCRPVQGCFTLTLFGYI